MELRLFKGLILILVLSIVVFPTVESNPSDSHGNNKMMGIPTTSNRRSSILDVRRLSSRVITSITSPSKKPTRPTCCYVPCLVNVHSKGLTKRNRSFITHNTVQYFHLHSSMSSTTFLRSQNDATQSKSTEQDMCFGFGPNNLPLSAQHWFTQLLPEGWCVGVCTDAVSGASLLHAATVLHPDEYQWGLDNIASSASRTSYYLGRMALRLSLDALLANESTDVYAQEKRMLCAQLKEEIHSTAINKDSYGRPILPDIISGSISHKGDNAVGLARFRSSWDNQQILGDNHFETMESSTIKWREECPILEDDDDAGIGGIDSVACTPSSSTVRGIGVDLERIDARRGKRIERKVLTETEQAELGGLADIGISSDEEVVLRFSLKESVYKALHPVICQYIGFQEAEITPRVDGTAKVTLNLLSGSHERLGIVVHSASWRKIGDYFLTSASVGLITR